MKKSYLNSHPGQIILQETSSKYAMGTYQIATRILQSLSARNRSTPIKHLFAPMPISIRSMELMTSIKPSQVISIFIQKHNESYTVQSTFHIDGNPLHVI